MTANSFCLKSPPLALPLAHIIGIQHLHGVSGEASGTKLLEITLSTGPPSVFTSKICISRLFLLAKNVAHELLTKG